MHVMHSILHVSPLELDLVATIPQAQDGARYIILLLNGVFYSFVDHTWGWDWQDLVTFMCKQKQQNYFLSVRITVVYFCDVVFFWSICLSQSCAIDSLCVQSSFHSYSLVWKVRAPQHKMRTTVHVRVGITGLKGFSFSFWKWHVVKSVMKKNWILFIGLMPFLYLYCSPFT